MILYKRKCDETPKLISGKNSQVYSHFNKIAKAPPSKRINFRELLLEVKDCRARKYILQSMAPDFSIGCNLAKATDPKCNQCPFNQRGQVVFNLIGDDENE